MLKKLRNDDHTKVLIKFAYLQIGYWAAMSVGNFFTVFMQENGFSVANIGIVNACISAVCIVGMPMWGMLSDRIRSVRKVALILMITTCSLIWLIPFTWNIKLGALPLSIVLGTIMFFFRNPSISIADNWTIRGALENNINYGTIRSLGSLGFALAGFAMSYLMPTLGVNSSFIISAVLMIPVVIVAFRIPDGKFPEKGSAAEKPSLKVLFKNYYYITYLIFFALFNIALTCNFVFLPFLVQSRNVPTSNIGFVTGFGALIEIPMLMLSGILRRRFPPYKLIIGALVFFTAESLLLGLTGAFWQIILVRSLFGLGNGLFIAGNANHIYSLAPDGLKATAQTIVAAVGSVSGIVGNMAGGFIMEAVGAGGFYTLVGGFMLIMSVLFVASFVIGNKVLKLDKPGLS